MYTDSTTCTTDVPWKYFEKLKECVPVATVSWEHVQALVCLFWLKNYKPVGSCQLSLDRWTFGRYPRGWHVNIACTLKPSHRAKPRLQYWARCHSHSGHSGRILGNGAECRQTKNFPATCNRIKAMRPGLAIQVPCMGFELPLGNGKVQAARKW